MSVQLEDILKLSVEERVQLIEAIWDSIAADPTALSLTDAQREELDRRLDDFERDPADTLSWAEVRASLERDE